MKRIVRRVQTLNERAAELTAAAGQLPNRVAELREAMTATSGQLQNLKSDIQINVADLRMDREDELGAAIAEIAGHAPVFAEAGFLLDGLDVEVSPVQRLIVQLVRIEDVDTLAIQPLIQQYQQQPAVRAILSAILKARATVATIDIDGLDYHKLVISVGPVPTIRLCWRAEEPAPAPAAASSAWQPAPSQPLAGGSSFFGPPLHPPPRATADAAPVPAHEPEDAEEPALTTTTSFPPPLPEQAHPHGEASEVREPVIATQPPAPPPLPPAPTDPLAKFKVMPNLGRER